MPLLALFSPFSSYFLAITEIQAATFSGPAKATLKSFIHC